MKAVIVDDEPRAIELLVSYLEHFSAIELVGTFRNGLKAFEFINNEKVDLLFLDINMPHLSGISLSKMIPNDIHIIFTTAYSEFAVESYEVQALDYLLKPVSLERFTKAVSKVLGSDPAKNSIHHKSTITVKSGFETFRIDADSILYLEKDGNYITYHMSDKKIIGRETVTEALSKLPPNFIRTHKSYIANVHKIESYNRNQLIILNHSLPIGENYRVEIMSALEE